MTHIRRSLPIALAASLVTVLLAACGTGAPTQPPSSGPTINVTPSQDLGTAVKDASAGSTLKLANGTYTLTSTLAISKDLTFEGGDPASVIVAFDGVNTTGVNTPGLTTGALSYHPVVDVEGGTFTASGVTFRYTGTAPANVVVVNNAKVAIKNSVFPGGVVSGAKDVGDGIDLIGTTTGTIVGSTFTGNGRSGFTLSDTADVTVSGSSSTSNLWGALFWGAAKGTASNNTFANNSLGILLSAGTGGPTPNLDGNAIHDNSDSGIVYLKDSAGTASNNTIENNASCGIGLYDTAHPTLTGNTLSGNGESTCDRRPGPALPPIAHQCSTANGNLNPDPSRYLAVVVEDASGNPLPGAMVLVTLLDGHGYNNGEDQEITDNNGVALLFDNTVYSWAPSGTMSGYVSVNGGAGTPALFTACGNLSNPGTITVQYGDSALSPVTFNVHDGSTTLSDVYVQFGYVYGGKADIQDETYVGPTGVVQALNGDYTMAVNASDGASTYLLYDAASVAAATTVDLNVATTPLHHVHFTVDDGSGTSGTNSDLTLFRKDPTIMQGIALGLFGPDLYATPGTYLSSAGTQLTDSSSNTWYYQFDLGSQDFSAAGATSTFSVGGPLTASVATAQSSYNPGALVTINLRATDQSGFALRWVDNWGNLGTAGNPIHGAAALATVVQRSSRFGPTRSTRLEALAGQAGVTGTPIVTVKDPNGTVVYQTTGTPSNLVQQQFTLDGSAPTGTYNVSLAWDLGPYQSTPLTASSTFTVQ